MSDLGALYTNCTLCPRLCAIDRAKGARGFCGMGRDVVIASACLHRGEEPPLSGSRGSGTVFFSGCTLKCPACQNWQISAGGVGKEVGIQELAEIFLALQDRGAQNINLVTGTHFVPSIVTAINMAREQGLALPIVWNTSGYETPASLALLDRFVDIYLPDLKTLEEGTAQELFGCRDYPAVVQSALAEMVAAKPLRWNGDLLKQGVIVRHLVIPGRFQSSRACLEWFCKHCAGRALLSLMFQYLPLERGKNTGRDKVNGREYDAVMELIERLGISEGFIQERPETDAWIPDFTKVNPFPSDYALPVWHPSQGFVSG